MTVKGLGEVPRNEMCWTSILTVRGLGEVPRNEMCWASILTVRGLGEASRYETCTTSDRACSQIHILFGKKHPAGQNDHTMAAEEAA